MFVFGQEAEHLHLISDGLCDSFILRLVNNLDGIFNASVPGDTLSYGAREAPVIKL